MRFPLRKSTARLNSLDDLKCVDLQYRHYTGDIHLNVRTCLIEPGGSAGEQRFIPTGIVLNKLTSWLPIEVLLILLHPGRWY